MEVFFDGDEGIWKYWINKSIDITKELFEVKKFN